MRRGCDRRGVEGSPWRGGRRAIAGFAFVLAAAPVPRCGIGRERRRLGPVARLERHRRQLHRRLQRAPSATVESATDHARAGARLREPPPLPLGARRVRRRAHDAQVEALESDPDGRLRPARTGRAHATDCRPAGAGRAGPPTGIRRIVAAKGNRGAREGGSPNVAVIDTGINLSHPDLNAVNGKDCVDLGTPAEDGNGHGTHVAGTIGAKNNGAGVTGVAPNTQDLRRPRAQQRGQRRRSSQIICGIDWVTANAAGEEHRGREHEPRRRPRRPAVALPGHHGRPAPGDLQLDRCGPA